METKDWISAGIGIASILVGVIAGIVAFYRNKWKKEGELDYKGKEQAKFNSNVLEQQTEQIKINQELYGLIHELKDDVVDLKEENKELNITLSGLRERTSHLEGKNDN